MRALACRKRECYNNGDIARRKGRTTAGTKELKGDAKRAIWTFIALFAAAALLEALPLLFVLIEGDAGAALYLLHLYAVLPLCALLLPALAAARGVHPLAAFFPVGLGLLFSPIYEAAGIAVLCLLIGLVGAVAGAEWRKRGHPPKGRQHAK